MAFRTSQVCPRPVMPSVTIVMSVTMGRPSSTARACPDRFAVVVSGTAHEVLELGVVSGVDGFLPDTVGECLIGDVFGRDRPGEPARRVDGTGRLQNPLATDGHESRVTRADTGAILSRLRTTG